MLRVQFHPQTAGQNVCLERFRTAARLSFLDFQGEPDPPSSFTLQLVLQLDPASLGHLFDHVFGNLVLSSFLKILLLLNTIFT